MAKKPRMPKSGMPAPLPPADDTPDEAASFTDEAVITDDPAPVTKITSKRSNRGKRAKPVIPAAAEEDLPPAPRSKMRERLLTAASKAPKKSKHNGVKQVDRDIWHRDDRATTFDNDPQPARQFSGRTVALLTVLFIAALIMAQPLQLLLEQQADISHAQQQLTLEREREQELETQLERWEDPAYVQQQARERFNMVMPGERKYLVIDDQQTTEETAPPVDPLDERIEMGWADRLWGSVLTSGQE